MRVGIVGAGNVGLTLAVKLGLAGHEIHVHSRSRRQMDDLQDAELDLGGVFDDRYVLRHVHAEAASFFAQSFDVIAICVKTPSLKDVLVKAQDLLPAPVPLLSCQNGLGIEDEIAAVVGDDNTLRMVLNFAGNVLETCVIKTQFFHPPNYISSRGAGGQELARTLAAELTRSGLDTEYSAEIHGRVFQKVILNCALSGICALTQMTMERAMRDADIVFIVRQLLLEGMQVAHLEGANLGDDYLQRAMHYLSHAGSHKPSMLIDIESGKPTEIDYLNHRILQLGRRHNIHLPFTNSITALVRGLQQTVCILGCEETP